MGKYLDLSSLIDTEPPISEVLPLIDDEDIQREFWERLDEEFFRDFVEGYCKQRDITIMKKIIDEAYENCEED